MADTNDYKIIVAGIGPGSKDYILPAALKLIKNAKVLVGGQRALTEYGEPAQKTMAIKGNIMVVMEFIKKEITNNDVVVMVSGDPGYFSLLDALRRNFPLNKLKVIAGISSMQYAFASVCLPWHEASLISLHGREPEDNALDYGAGRIIGMLTDSKYTSHTVADLLLTKGWQPDSRFYICSRLSYADEAIITTTLAKAKEMQEVKNCILIVEG